MIARQRPAPDPDCRYRRPQFDFDAPMPGVGRRRREKRWVAQSSCQTLIGRLMSRVQTTDTHWLWTGAPSTEGYGTISVKNRVEYAHRVMYEIAYGPIPAGLQIDHLCRTPLCVNPEHLEAVTPSTNLKRGYHFNSVKTHCPQGHRYDQDNTIWSHRRDGRIFRQCRTCMRVRWRVTPIPPSDPAKVCAYCGGRGWVVGGDEVRDCYCRGLVATDLTADNSALRGRRDALRHEAGLG